MDLWNRLVYAIESLLRRSSLGQRIRGMGMENPNLHRVLLRAQEFLLPYRQSDGLTRYQARAIQRFLTIARRRQVLGRVLEVGTDDTGAVAARLRANGATRVVGINPSGGSWRSGGSAREVILVRADGRAVPMPDASLDAIFSVATFEHIHNLEVAMREFSRVLRPGGILFTDFGPIWSSSVGHHVYAKVGTQEARHWKPGLNPVPDFGHLLYSQVEMMNRLRGKCSPELADVIIEWIYDGEGINRLFFEDYMKIFATAPIKLETLAAVREHIDEEILLRLMNSHPGYRRFDCRMIEAIFIKEGSPQ